MIVTTPVFPLSRIFFLTVNIDPARFRVKRFVMSCTSRLLFPSPLVGEGVAEGDG
jgi:hypothetical protein